MTSGLVIVYPLMGWILPAPIVVSAMDRTKARCRDRLISPFGPGSIWNTAIGSEAEFAPAHIFAAAPHRNGVRAPPNKRECANMTANPTERHTCPGAYGGITPAQCAAKGCCFSNVPCNASCPWCFTADREFGPLEFHNDRDFFVAVEANDPAVTWWMQGWWGNGPPKSACLPSAGNSLCHCYKLPGTNAFERKLLLPDNWTTGGELGNNGLSMLQPDRRTVIQTQPACTSSPLPTSPLLGPARAALNAAHCL